MSSGAAHQEKKNKSKPNDGNVNLKIRSQDGEVVFFKIRRSTQLKKMLSCYCDRQFLNYNETRFLINGKRFPHNKTPDQVGLEDGEEIDAMIEQIGGGYMII